MPEQITRLPATPSPFCVNLHVDNILNLEILIVGGWILQVPMAGLEDLPARPRERPRPPIDNHSIPEVGRVVFVEGLDVFISPLKLEKRKRTKDYLEKPNS